MEGDKAQNWGPLVRSSFGPNRTYIRMASPALRERNYFNLQGLNMYLPDEVMNDNETPHAHNFRMYDPSLDFARTAISKRNGHRAYSVPIGEASHTTNTSTTGEADKTLTSTTWLAMPLTTSAAGRVSKIEVRVKNNNGGTAPLIIELRSDSSGSPGITVLAQTSISQANIGSSYDYEGAYVIDAPDLSNATDYWIVCYQQDNALGDYKWASNTSTTLAKTSSNSGGTWSSTSYSLNFKLYYATSGGVKGQTRFYRSTTTPLQVFAHGTNIYSVNDGTGATTSIASSLNGSATDYQFGSVNNLLLWVNGFDNIKKWDGSTTSDLGGTPGIGKSIALHKNRVFVLSATDPNLLKFSDAADYEVFQSTSFLYVPSPKFQDPGVGIISFQDNLVTFTRNNKYILQGSDLASFVLREATSKKGAVGPLAIDRDDSYIYFLSDDGLNRFNGGVDELLSEKVDPIIQSISDKSKCRVHVHDNKVYIYYGVASDANSTNCLIYDIKYKQWLHDTGIICIGSNSQNSQTDADIRISGSSRLGMVMYTDDETSDLGKAIDFEYRTKYHTFGSPSKKHRVKRFYPYFQPTDGSHYVNCQVDVDDQNSPTDNYISVSPEGAEWGGGAKWGDGTTWGSSILEPERITIPGQNRKHQLRFKQSQVDTPVRLIGYTLYTRDRRPI